MKVYLVRHAKAGERGAWDEADELRPLSGRGHRQARGLLAVLRDAHFDRVVSSPYVRCMETVVPLAAERAIPLESSDALAEGAPLDEAVALVRKVAANGAVLCTHGDVLPMLLDYYERRGIDLGKTVVWPKGCTWVLETDSTGEVRSAEYLPPPPD